MDNPQHHIVVGLGYGDEGKGSVVDWLCASQPVHTVVRFNGGAQAGHNVVMPDGRQHCFSQFGSGTLQGARTHLSRFILVEPLALSAEAEHLIQIGIPDPYSLLTIDREALLTTPYHIAANRARERARGDNRHGSCGKGIGETVAYELAMTIHAPRIIDCTRPAMLTRKLDRLLHWLTAEVGDLDDVPSVAEAIDAYRAFARHILITGPAFEARLLKSQPVVFEGAQGVLLDEHHGIQPYTTWSNTTFHNAERLLAEAGNDIPAVRIGVTRTYMTRHGPGPFATEDPDLTIPEPHNPPNAWQGVFRVGRLSIPELQYAITACNGVDEIALTHIDTALAHPELRAPSESDLGKMLGAPVSIISYGPTAEAKSTLPK